jgi:hypothetical protein
LLRRQVRWRVADLAEKMADGLWDVILWRNLAIYLNPGPTETLWNRLAGALAPAGFLVVGKAERPPAGLGLVPVCRCVYRKSGPTAAQRSSERPSSNGFVSSSRFPLTPDPSPARGEGRNGRTAAKEDV